MASNTEIPFHKRLRASIDESVQTSGLSRATLYRYIAEQKLKTVKVGGRRLVVVPSLLELIGEPQEAA
jgi:predicted DNA-binding transcriptional regulator AlpA